MPKPLTAKDLTYIENHWTEKNDDERDDCQCHLKDSWGPQLLFELRALAEAVLHESSAEALNRARRLLGKNDA